jgi:hypothetical protein
MMSSSKEDRPIVSFLGPFTSYTHQVHSQSSSLPTTPPPTPPSSTPFTLVDFTKPAWVYGLTDCDLAQAALGAFEVKDYEYRPANTITGKSSDYNS